MRPHTEKQHAFQVKIPVELHERVVDAAAGDGRTIRAFTMRALEREIAEVPAKRPASKKKMVASK
jgi:predicted HicB family RNase H-like nuclease